MKDLHNPKYIENTLSETRFNMEGLVFELRAVHEVGPPPESNEIKKMLLSVSTRIEGNNGIACVQHDFMDADTVKKLGMWLIENADRVFDKTK